MKIYLAGKVTKNGWRTDIVRGAKLNGMDPDDHEKPWPVLERVIFGEHDYVGPFLYGCDHGCFHGNGQHGMTFGEDGACSVEPFFIDGREIVRRCLDAVHRTDLVFCWLESSEDYGSMVEVGYALALGKQVVVAGARGSGRPYGWGANPLTDSHWFAAEASSLVIANTPKEALQETLRVIAAVDFGTTPGAKFFSGGGFKPSTSPVVQDGLPVEVWRACESPIEKSLMAGVVAVASRAGVRVIFKLKDKDINLTSAPGESMVIWPQCQVCNHRADFVVEFCGARAVVECDGHAYHERTKKQAERDRGLDRAFQREGFRVFRFTGSEIWAGREVCAATLIRDLQSATIQGR